MRGRTDVVIPVLAVLAAAGFAFLACGCKTASAPAASAPAQAEELSGVQVWAANCGRCHNLRDPSSYSSAQWEVIVRHMRQRAELTGEQEKAVREYLTSK
jgi:cytochrome c553